MRVRVVAGLVGSFSHLTCLALPCSCCAYYRAIRIGKTNFTAEQVAENAAAVSGPATMPVPATS